jgi:hypothetical protein
MLNTSLGLAGLVIVPLMTWLMAPALICFAALCVAALPLLPLILMSRRRARSVGRRPRRGLPARTPLAVAPLAAARGVA